MRKSFALTEIIVLIEIAAIISIPMSAVFLTLIYEIPSAYRIMQTDTSIIHVLKTLQNDADDAENIADVNGMLIITVKDVVVRYRFANELIERFSEDAVAQNWKIPKFKIQWKILTYGSGTQALEVRTHAEYPSREQLGKKLERSRLYFIGAMKEQGEK